MNSLVTTKVPAWIGMILLAICPLFTLAADNAFEQFQKTEKNAMRRFMELQNPSNNRPPTATKEPGNTPRISMDANTNIPLSGAGSSTFADEPIAQEAAPDTETTVADTVTATPDTVAIDPETTMAPPPDAEPYVADPAEREVPELAAVLPTLPQITNWLPPPAVTNIQKYAIPENPCSELTLAPAKEEEEPAATPEALLSTPLAQNIGAITKARYQAVVSAAHEATRLILGEMSPERTEIFECRWMALYDFPSARVVNWIDRLNPLLVEFLGLTQAVEALLLEMAELQYEAEMAAAYENEAETRQAMEQIRRAGETLKQLGGRLKGVSEAVTALGDPPDPREDKCRTRRKYKEYLAPPFTDGAWVLTNATTEVKWKNQNEMVTINEMTFSNHTALAYSVVPAEFIGEDFPDYVIRWFYEWTPPASVLRPDEQVEIECRVADAGTVYGDEKVNVKIYMTSTNHVADRVVYNGMVTGWGEEKLEFGQYNTLIAEIIGSIGGWKRLTPQQDSSNHSLNGYHYSLGFIPTGKTHCFKQELLPGKDGWTMTIEIRLTANYIHGVARYDYVYDSSGSAPPFAPIEEPETTTETMEPEDQSPPETVPPEDQGPTEEELADALLKEKVDFHRNQISMIEDDIKRYQEMLVKVKPNDQDSRMALEYSLITKLADLQQQHDQIATLMTGSFVRTRTAYDEMVSLQMQANSRELAARILEDRHRSGTVDRLIKLLPEAERYSTTEWARQQLGNGAPDSATLRKVAAVIAKKADGYNQAEAAQYEELAAEAQYTIDVLENYQTAARYSMYLTPFVSGGPALAFAYGITSGGIDGYQTGGLLGEENKGALGAAVGGVTTAARYLSAHIDYGLTFYEGYTQPDASGEQGGLSGALERVAITFVQRKAMQTLAQGVLRYQARTQAVHKQARLDAWRDAKRRYEFTQEQAYGKAMVERHQEYYQSYKQAKSSGAPAPVVVAAEARMMEQTAAVMHAPHAKGYLKFNASPEQQRAYNSTSRLHINRVVHEYRAELQRQGVDADQLHFATIRNAGNTSPGMDTDIAMESRLGNRIPYTDPDTGQRQDLDLYRGNQMMQSIFNSVYRRMSGNRGAEHESWVKITSCDNLEAYRDRSWLHTAQRYSLGLNPKTGIDPRHAADAARVTEHKMNDLNQGSHAPDNKLWEKFRGTAKDIDGKVLPLLKQRIEESQSPSQRTELGNRLRFYMELRNAMNLSNHDPVAAEQAVKQLTGFEPVEAMKMTTLALEALGKW